MTKNIAEGSFIINGQYIKDFSFETPNGAGTFLIEGEGQPSVDFDIMASQLENNVYEVALKMQIDLKINDVAIYLLQIDYRGIFTIEGFEGEALNKTLMVQCPLFLYPYLRSLVHNLIASSSFAPPVMNPIDFLGIYMSKFGATSVSEGELPN